MNNNRSCLFYTEPDDNSLPTIFLDSLDSRKPSTPRFHISLTPIYILLQVSYIFGDMSEYVLIKLKHDWTARSHQKRFPIIDFLLCIFLALASNIFVSYHPGVLHMYWSNWSTTGSARVIVPYCLKLPNKCSTLCFSLRLLAGWQCLTCATFIAIKSTKPVLQAKGQKELLEKFVMKFSGPFWFLIITASCAI